MRVALVRATGCPFVAPSRRRQLGEEPARGLLPCQLLLFLWKYMPNDVANAFARIDLALARIERFASSARAPGSVEDARYERLRTRTQAALAELDTVIARVADKEPG